MSKIFITSDTHFGHNKDFIYGPRGFNSIQEHDEAIIENWNKVVTAFDEVYHLGDVMLGDNEYGMKCLKRLNGHIYIVVGNHDTDTRQLLYKKCQWPQIVEVDKAIDLKWKGYHFHLTHYPTITSNFDDKKILNHKILGICGHSHCKNKFIDMNKGIIYHVELDCQKNMPIEINQIIEDITYFDHLSIEEKKKITSMEVYNN